MVPVKPNLERPFLSNNIPMVSGVTSSPRKIAPSFLVASNVPFMNMDASPNP